MQEHTEETRVDLRIRMAAGLPEADHGRHHFPDHFVGLLPVPGRAGEHERVDEVTGWLKIFGKNFCQAFLKMSQKSFNISPDYFGAFAIMKFYPLCYNSIIHVMRLFLNKFSEGRPSPWMVHGWNIFFLRFGSRLLSIQFLRCFMPLFYFIQNIDIFIIDTAVQGTVKCLNDHHFCTFTVVYLPSAAVQHPVMIVFKLDAVSAIYSPLIEYSKSQIDFLICGLRFKRGLVLWMGSENFALNFFM